jgi:hypothetical protein
MLETGESAEREKKHYSNPILPPHTDKVGRLVTKLQS